MFPKRKVIKIFFLNYNFLSANLQCLLLEFLVIVVPTQISIKKKNVKGNLETVERIDL